MKLFVKTKEKKYRIYFGANSYLKIMKITLTQKKQWLFTIKMFLKKLYLSLGLN